MDKNKLVPSVIIAVSLIISSLILSHSMSKLGVNIVDAGIYSGNAGELENKYNQPLRIILDDGSEVRLRKDQDPNE
jgi:hypothetical protein